MTSTSILLVEPKDEFAQPIIKVLVQSGYRVTHVRTGRSALLEPRTAITLVSSNLPDMCVREFVHCHNKQVRAGVAELLSNVVYGDHAVAC